MSEHEISTLIYDLFRDSDAQVEFWIQATFAVVVAVFFAGDRLSTGIRRLIAFIYLSASLLAATRWGLSIYRTLEYRERMTEAGMVDIPTSGPVIAVVVVLTNLIFFAGLGGTMWFLWRPRRIGEAERG